MKYEGEGRGVMSNFEYMPLIANMETLKAAEAKAFEYAKQHGVVVLQQGEGLELTACPVTGAEPVDEVKIFPQKTGFKHPVSAKGAAVIKHEDLRFRLRRALVDCCPLVYLVGVVMVYALMGWLEESDEGLAFWCQVLSHLFVGFVIHRLASKRLLKKFLWTVQVVGINLDRSIFVLKYRDHDFACNLYAQHLVGRESQDCISVMFS